jgi:hypothetical protein
MDCSRAGPRQRGQSLVEFAISSIVLVILFGGLVDAGRMLHHIDVLKESAREGARRGAYFNTGTTTNSYLDDSDIKSAADSTLTGAGLPASVLRNSVTPCPSTADGNTQHNPPYANAALPTVANVPWLYICYDNNPALDYPAPANAPAGYQRKDLNVIVVFAYGPLSSFLPSPLPVGGFGLAANVHLEVQGH